MIKTDIAPPEIPNIILRAVRSIVPSPKVVSIVDSRVNIETQADARLIAFDAEYTGLLYFLYFIMFMIAIVNAVKVYAAIAMVVIS